MTRYTFRDIASAPRDGRTLILSDDTGWQAVGHWSKDFWAEGHKGGSGPVIQLDFEPTNFADPHAEEAA